MNVLAQGTVVHYQARHQPYAETQAYHADDRLVARHLRIDARFDALLAKPLIHALPCQTGFRENERHLSPIGRPVLQALQTSGLEGRDEDQRRLRQRLDGQIGRRPVGNGGDADVLLLAQDAFQGDRRVTGMQFDLDARMAATEQTEQIIEKAVTGCHRAEKADLPPQGFVLLRQGVAEAEPEIESLVGIVPEALPSGRERHPPVVPLEQRPPHLLLQALDDAREAGGTDVAGLTGAGEDEGLGEVQKKVQILLVHMPYLPHMPNSETLYCI